MSQKRSIFEEVGESGPKEAPKAATKAVGVIDSGNKGARKGIRAWLMVLFAMVVVMIVVGGLTRLTESGLSITPMVGRSVIRRTVGLHGRAGPRRPPS